MIVDDDIEICNLLQQFLEKYNYKVIVANDGEQMFEQLSKHTINLFILDMMLPGDDGLTLCRKLRQQYETPILILSAVGEDTDRIVGLEVGADDYLSKPFNPRELLARIKAILRRSQPAGSGEVEVEIDSDKYYFADWSLDVNTRELKQQSGSSSELSTGEYDLLLAFLQRPQHTLTRDHLLETTRHRDSSPFDRSIDMQVSRLRQKIEINPRKPKIIKTIRGGGYIFTEKVTRSRWRNADKS